eukprot:CAMPEP_0118900388 /NCGR_PEP_ID=MMETSP1166-20130328/6524_1 /TAXON_ID=1104430 /ORGANISM="Chrysoreinhardia sp, Strain CCMP3193" /LENGTH=181 /DNA_ID=CAMNT_0006839527 /DNA_START=117 /DNA_END=662 /DNA_ORIENTATION=-
MRSLPLELQRRQRLFVENPEASSVDTTVEEDSAVASSSLSSDSVSSSDSPAGDEEVSNLLEEQDFAQELDLIKFVKRRDDWWSEGSVLNSPISGADEGPVRALAEKFPLPSYAYLLTSVVGAIAFVGCIFQLFYNVPPAPVLGVPVTSVILVLSGPAFLFLFLTAITRGQIESEFEDDNEW